MIYKAIINKIKTNYLLVFLIMIGLVWLTTCTFAHLEGYTASSDKVQETSVNKPIISIQHQESIGKKTAELLSKVNENYQLKKS
jgi:hypothetical protein